MGSGYRAVWHRLIRTHDKSQSAARPDTARSGRAPAAQRDGWSAGAFGEIRSIAQSSTSTSVLSPCCRRHGQAVAGER